MKKNELIAMLSELAKTHTQCAVYDPKVMVQTISLESGESTKYIGEVSLLNKVVRIKAGSTRLHICRLKGSTISMGEAWHFFFILWTIRGKIQAELIRLVPIEDGALVFNHSGYVAGKGAVKKDSALVAAMAIGGRIPDIQASTERSNEPIQNYSSLVMKTVAGAMWPGLPRHG